MILSLILHATLGLVLIWIKGVGPDSGAVFIASGPGEGQGGGAIEVGVVGASELLRFSGRVDLGSLRSDVISQTTVERAYQIEDHILPTQPTETIPKLSTEKTAIPDRAVSTERPVERTTERVISDTGIKSSTGPSALIGTTGSPFPGNVRGGIGLGLSDLSGHGQGIPGGSEYGHRIQQALIGYYRLTPRAESNPQYVVVRVRIARDGRVLSINDGRLNPDAFVHKSGSVVIDTRVSAALLELDRHPIAFPPDFLPGVQEAIAEIYFQY